MLTPSAVDRLRSGRIFDAATPGLSIEVLVTGKKRWLYRRRLAGMPGTLKRSLGVFPATTIADARSAAAALNAQIESGCDPRARQERAQSHPIMTVGEAHSLYIQAIHAGRGSRAHGLNKPRTIADKLEIYERDIAPTLRNRAISAVTEAQLVELVEAKGLTAKVRANRLAAELRVFFRWTTSLRGRAVGLETDPARRLGELRFPEEPRSRILSMQEISWLLRAISHDVPHVCRGLLLCLLTAARISEVVRARTDELVDGVWHIPVDRTKNSHAHRLPLGPWAHALMQGQGEWVFPAPRGPGPRTSGWYDARDRVKRRMERLAGRRLERFTPHDLRRTARSNTKRLGVDYETAEAMLNHVKKGLERTYDRYELEDEKRAWFLKWEREIARVALDAGVADKLAVPPVLRRGALPKRTGVEPGQNL